jgi:phosphate transport system permease protein
MALATALPAFMVLFVWSAVEPTFIQALVRNRLPADIQALQADQLSLVLTTIENLAYRNIPPSQSQPYLTEAAALMRELHATANWLMVGVCMVVALCGFFLARGRITAEFRARNTVETVVKMLMIICSSIAILTTVGIVMSMLVESLHFFAEVSPLDFFFGLVWDPRFAGAARADQTGSLASFPCFGERCLFRLWPCLWQFRSGCFLPCTCPNMPGRSSARLRSPFSKFWPASRLSSTGSSR